MDATLTIPLPNRRATRRLGAAVACAARAGDRVFLEGPLGAGKTFLVRGLARALGVPASVPIQSPTFALVHDYVLAGPGPGRLVHADLYRLGEAGEVGELGLEEADDAVLCIEWGERFREAIDGREGSLLVTLATSPRMARLEGRGPRGLALLADVRDTLASAESAG